MHYSMARMEREANKYRRGLITSVELTWDAWTTAREDSRGIIDPVEALRTNLSPQSFEAVRDAAKMKLVGLEDATGFVPYDRCDDLSEIESSPDFVPRAFIERLASNE